MNLRKELYLFFFLSLLALPVFSASNSAENRVNDSVQMGISQDETILFNMINDMRRQNKLSSFPLSRDLCIVAQTHIADLIKYRPQEKGCSLHSWSGNGKWTSCCNTKELFGIQCMKSKPKEITGYTGEGYELIYLGEDKASPVEAVELWKQVEASADMILSRSKWSAYQWKAIGVGMKDGYAVLWLGDAEDKNDRDKTVLNNPVVQQPAAKVMVAEKPVTKETIKPNRDIKQNTTSLENIRQTVGVPGIRFYIIVASYKEFESANTVMKEVRSQGYPSAFILYQEPLHRVVIYSYETYEKASVKKNELKEKFPGIWILKK